MKKELTIFLLFLTVTTTDILSQNAGIHNRGNSQTINHTDANGMRQGYWERSYMTGQTMYKAFFVDNKPVGEMLRYHPNGNMMARITYDHEGMNGQGELFDENGRKIAEGNYKGTDKDGEWKFYNERGRLIGLENYKDNLRDGESIAYYPNGNVASKTNWKNGKQDGSEVMYYPRGRERLTANYRDGNLHGAYTVFFENGRREIFGMYKNGRMHGPWFFFNALGSEDYRINYEDGVAKETEMLDKQQEERFREFERNKGRLRDPENYMDDPDGYMMGR